MSEPYKVYYSYKDFIMDIKQMNPVKLYGEDIVEAIKNSIGLENAIALLASNEIEASVIISKLLDYGLIKVSDVISLLSSKGIKIDLDFYCDKRIVVKINEDNKSDVDDNYVNSDNRDSVDDIDGSKDDEDEDVFSVFDDDE